MRNGPGESMLAGAPQAKRIARPASQCAYEHLPGTCHGLGRLRRCRRRQRGLHQRCHRRIARTRIHDPDMKCKIRSSAPPCAWRSTALLSDMIVAANIAPAIRADSAGTLMNDHAHEARELQRSPFANTREWAPDPLAWRPLTHSFAPRDHPQLFSTKNRSSIFTHPLP
jgi:hypothetical protein